MIAKVAESQLLRKAWPDEFQGLYVKEEISELVKEILFLMQILEHLNIEVELPVKVYVDNVGAIYMTRNNSGNAGTKHVNYRMHFVREVHGRLVELIFVRSEDNEADIMTKNMNQKEQDKHVPKLVSKIPKSLIKKGIG